LQSRGGARARARARAIGRGDPAAMVERCARWIGRGEVAANPVAAALLMATERYRLPREPLAALIEARRHDLYDAPIASVADLERYCEGVASGLLTSAARVLGGAEADISALARHAGTAQAIGGLLKAFPIHAGRGRIYLPL